MIYVEYLGQSDVPGPGNYHISRDVMENESPAYSMRQQLKAVESEYISKDDTNVSLLPF